MGATFNRLKTWISEKLTSEDLNAEIDNILDNLDPLGTGDYSANVSQMRVQEDPGEVGSESQAVNLAGELARIRHQLAETKGTEYWYETAPTSITELNNILGTSVLGPNRLSSGITTGNSSQSLVLVPEGDGDNITIDATPTPIVYYINSTQYTLDTDITLTVQTAPPVANNTALVNDASAMDQDETKYYGEYDSVISIDTVGAEITSRNGRLVTFKINNGAENEYFIARVNTTAGQLEECRRGYFFGASGERIPRITFSDNDVITLMNTNWIFLTSTGTTVNTYNAPTVSVAQPVSPTNGDIWYDLNASKWKQWNGATFIDTDAFFIGLSIIDENGNCVAARSVDYTSATSATNTIELTGTSATTVTARSFGACNVYGSEVAFLHDKPVWNITTHLDTGISEAANTRYYVYLKENGTPLISDVRPIDFTTERKGLYHPHETWRAMGYIDNDGSSDFILDTAASYYLQSNNEMVTTEKLNIGESTGLTIEETSAGIVGLSIGGTQVANISSTGLSSTMRLRAEGLATGNTDFTVPANVFGILAQGCGTGGKGGDGDDGTTAGSGGSGAPLTYHFVDCEPGDILRMHISSSNAGDASLTNLTTSRAYFFPGGQNGQNGASPGSTQVRGQLWTVPGGRGAAGITAPESGSQSLGFNGGAPGEGLQRGGGGGAGPFGNGGNGSDSSTAGTAGPTNSGAGGGGGSYTGANKVGLNGGTGRIQLWF